MKWRKKYIVDIDEVHRRNVSGESLPKLSKDYNIPRTTLNRYLKDAGYDVQMNRGGSDPYYVTKKDDYDFEYSCTFSWKTALIYVFGHKCFVCGYDKIVEAHHIVPVVKGGKTTVRNGILLCPNHHAEVHAKLLDLSEALVKLGELLGSPEEGNQQPSLECKHDIVPRVEEGSETSKRAKAVILPRDPRSRTDRRHSKEDLREMYPKLRDKI